MKLWHAHKLILKIHCAVHYFNTFRMQHNNSQATKRDGNSDINNGEQSIDQVLANNNNNKFGIRHGVYTAHARAIRTRSRITHALTNSRTYSRTHSALAHLRTRTLTHSRTHARAHSRTPRTLALTLLQSRTLAITHSCNHALLQSRTLAITHSCTDALTHTHSRTRTHARAYHA
jgi:hypothetical protein